MITAVSHPRLNRCDLLNKPMFTKLFLKSAGVAIRARKFRIRGVDMNEIISVCIDLLQCFTAALCQDEMTRLAIARFYRLLPITSNVLPVMTTETSIPILVSDEIGVSAPIDFHFGKKILAINRLSHIDDWIRLRGVGICCA